MHVFNRDVARVHLAGIENVSPLPDCRSFDGAGSEE